jgi:MFS family permease
MRALVILLAGQAMASMDGSILAVAAPSLQADLHASSGQLQLTLAMYIVAFAAFVVTGARLGDVVGPRRAFLMGLGGFTISSLCGGLAPTPAALIVARAGQGAAGAVMTPQVLSIIQRQYEGETRARAVGAYSMILAVGVAAGQVLGGLLVSAHLLHDAWRPALLLNAPVGVALLFAAPRWLPHPPALPARRLDLLGAALLGAAMLALVVPLSFGRDAGWPVWTWPCLVGCATLLVAFVRVERVRRDPVLDIGILRLPSVAAGVLAVLLVMGSYAGFLLSLTLHLKQGLGFSALHAGAVFAAYATGFATASLTWPRAGAALRDRLPVVGPLLMAAALLAVGLIARDGGWPAAPTAILLFAGGAGHACAFSPLANRLTAAVAPTQVADLSGLVLTASLIGSTTGVAGLAGVYLSAADRGSGHALGITTGVAAVALLATAVCAGKALSINKETPWLAFARRS